MHIQCRFPFRFPQYLRSAAIIAMTLAPVSAMAADVGDFWIEFQRARSQNQVTTSLVVDNDTLLLNHNDGFYTSGLQLTRQFALDGGSGSAKPAAISYGWRIGQALYTASDIKLPPARVYPPDHPYAGWLYAGVFRESAGADGSHERFGIDLGCLGPCALGRGTQTTLHRILGQPLPQGWSRQVRNEVGAILHADIAPVRWQAGRSVDLTPGIQGRLGNIHSDVATSLLLRVGQLEAGPGWQGFSRVHLRAVGYDATLQGGYFSSTSPHVVRPKRLVGEAELGLRWQIRQVVLSASVIRTGNEIAGLSNAVGAQNFVRLQLDITP